MANSVDPDQTAPIGAVCSGSTLFASVINLSVMLCNYLQQTTSADGIFRCIFFLALYGLISIFFLFYPPTLNIICFVEKNNIFLRFCLCIFESDTVKSDCYFQIFRKIMKYLKIQYRLLVYFTTVFPGFK